MNEENCQHHAIHSGWSSHFWEHPECISDDKGIDIFLIIVTSYYSFHCSTLCFVKSKVNYKSDSSSSSNWLHLKEGQVLFYLMVKLLAEHSSFWVHSSTGMWWTKKIVNIMPVHSGWSSTFEHTQNEEGMMKALNIVLIIVTSYYSFHCSIGFDIVGAQRAPPLWKKHFWYFYEFFEPPPISNRVKEGQVPFYLMVSSLAGHSSFWVRNTKM